ncbi:MAG: rhodanese-like domain-containing protein [Xanthobacteraceae bacterium]
MAQVRNLTPEDVARGLTENTMVVVDVREPREIETERIAGSHYMPMSAFDPDRLPDPQGRVVVFSCASGIRSITASEIAQAAGLPYDAHLAGGLKAWKAAGLPVER